MESRPVIVNPTPFIVDENLHKIGLLDSLRYREQNVLTPSVTCAAVIDRHIKG